MTEFKFIIIITSKETPFRFYISIKYAMLRVIKFDTSTEDKRVITAMSPNTTGTSMLITRHK